MLICSQAVAEHLLWSSLHKALPLPTTGILAHINMQCGKEKAQKCSIGSQGQGATKQFPCHAMWVLSHTAIVQCEFALRCRAGGTRSPERTTNAATIQGNMDRIHFTNNTDCTYNVFLYFLVINHCLHLCWYSVGLDTDSCSFPTNHGSGFWL